MSAQYSPEAALQAAMQALRARRWEEAAELLRDLLWRDPSNPVAYAAMGLALTQLGDTAGAVHALERAHFLKPDDPNILYQYGLALQAAGRSADAHLRFEGVVRLKTHRAAAQEELALLAARMSPPAFLPENGESATSAPEASPAPESPEPPDSPSPPAASPPRPWIEAPSPGPAGEPAPAPAVSTPPPPAGTAPRRVAVPLPERPAPEALTEEGPPRFMGLCAAVVTLWLQQPLVWLGGLAVPCGLAAVFVPPAGVRPWAAALLWTAALALAAAPLCTAAVSQWLHGRPVDPEGRALWSRLGAGYALLAPWVLLGPGSLAAALGWRGVEGVYAVLLGLLLTAPFHVLLAPALALVLTRGMAPGPALREALRLASGRTWLHLGALLTAGIPLAGGLVLLLWSLSVTLYAPGEVARKTYEIAELSAAGSLWAVTLAVLGTDAVATAPPEPDAD